MERKRSTALVLVALTLLELLCIATRGAAQQSPDSKVIRYHLAMDQLQLGLRDQARTNLESALTGADSFQGVEEARLALANLKVRA